jgi:antitoxin HigA-1
MMASAPTCDLLDVGDVGVGPDDLGSRVLSHAVDPLGRIASNPCEGIKQLYRGDRWLDQIGDYFGELRVAQFDRPEKIRPVIRRWRNQWADKPRTADEFLEPMKISVYALAQAIKVPRSRVNDIVRGRRGITADTAFRLARYFGTTPELWINLQARYDLDVANRTLRRRIEREASPRAA